MAGYSGTPLPKKLGIKPATKVALVDAPPGFETLLEPLPADVVVVRHMKGCDPFEVIVFFVRARAELAGRLARIAERLDPIGGLWIAWPKKASGVATDLSEDVLREVVLPTGMVDNKVCAIDETWSGLRFVVRKANRPGTAAPD